MEILYWSSRKERWAAVGPFGSTVVPLDEALRTIADEPIFWVGIWYHHSVKNVQSRAQGVSEIRPGTDDPVLAAMKEYGIPLTRENYIELAYLGDKTELGPEEEANLSVFLRKR
jgi:hypothetical protein